MRRAGTTLDRVVRKYLTKETTVEKNADEKEVDIEELRTF